MRTGIVAAGILVLFIAFAGCTGNREASSYSVNSQGILSVSCAPVTISEEILFKNETYTKSKIVLHTRDGDVVTVLAAPEHPKAAIVYVPGAGEKPTGHEARMVRYAAEGYAFLFVDIRGNGGETPGYPFNPQKDFSLFEKGTGHSISSRYAIWSMRSRSLPAGFSVPVYAMGSSNGGRFAAVATGVDPDFAGYVGVSTSDWGVLDSVIQQGYSGDLIRFATSIEPRTYFPKISPRPVWIFHAEMIR